MKKLSLLVSAAILAFGSTAILADETGGGKTNSTSTTRLSSATPPSECSLIESWLGLCASDTDGETSGS